MPDPPGGMEDTRNTPSPTIGRLTSRTHCCEDQLSPGWLSDYLSDAMIGWSDRRRFGWAAFPARNLRLEERLSTTRAAQYLAAVGEPRSQRDWELEHLRYEVTEVQRAGSPARSVLAKSARSEWPSPFRELRTPGDVLTVGPDVSLVHVASAFSVARDTPSLGEAELLDALEEKDEDVLDYALDNWWKGRASRCVFGAFAADLRPLISAAANGDGNWANETRDRLGLVHHDPLSGPINVLLFEFRASLIPRVEGLRQVRPIVAPAAIDSGLNPAYCPVAPYDQPGRCVDLEARLENPVREVIHPCPRFSHRELVASGAITSGVPDLAQARAAHLAMIQELVGPTDYANGIDDDLED